MNVGACVTVESVDYIYTGGEESGVRIGFINYPRFPADSSHILESAKGLAELLMMDMCQHSYSITTPETTFWRSRRAPDPDLSVD